MQGRYEGIGNTCAQWVQWKAGGLHASGAAVVGNGAAEQD